MSDIAISVIEAEIQREYAPDEAEAIIRKFHDMHYGNTEYQLRDENGICSGEYGVYSGDVAIIFGRLKIPIKFIGTNGKELAVDGSDVDVSICKGEYSHVGSVETGVEITHRASGITV
jgi:hypothetical protein